jgi:hypothetical protein
MTLNVGTMSLEMPNKNINFAIILGYSLDFEHGAWCAYRRIILK